MKEFKIENNIMDESIIHEIKPFLIQKWRKYMLIFIGIFMFFLALNTVKSSNESIKSISAFGFVFSVFSVFLYIRLPIDAEKRIIKTLREISGEALCYDINLSKDCIKIDDSTTGIKYDAIARIIVTERTITLFTKNNACLIIRKDNLELKTYNEIVDFLTLHCHHAKWTYR